MIAATRLAKPHPAKSKTTLQAIAICAAGLGVLSPTAGCSDEFRIVRGNGELEEVETVVEGFTRVEIDTQSEVTITIGAQSRVTVNAESNLIEHIEVEVEDGVLVIHQNVALLDPTERLLVLIETPNLSELQTQGTTNVEVLNQLSEPSFSLTAEGTGSTEIAELTATATSLSMSGTGSLIVAGTTDTLDLTLSGTGSIELEELIARGVTVELSGTGSVSVNASESVEGSADGTGSLEVFGEPPLVDVETSGTWSVEVQ